MAAAIGAGYQHFGGASADSATFNKGNAKLFKAFAQRLGRTLYKALNSLLQGIVIHFNGSLCHALAFKTTQKPLGRGSPKQKLGGDAAAVEAHATKMTVFNQRYRFSTTGKYACGLGTARPTTDNNNIKCIHACSTIGKEANIIGEYRGRGNGERMLGSCQWQAAGWHPAGMVRCLQRIVIWCVA